MDLSDLWIPATLAAAAAQTARNAAQRSLTERIGTVGATQVRFLYGLPFALLFLCLMPALTGEEVPGPTSGFFAYIALGSVAQILATAGMLAAMRGRSFAVVTAIIKIEPVLVALFGIALLGDTLTVPTATAILVATTGVVILSVKPGAGLSRSGLAPFLYGIAAGGLFALAAIGFRGAILSLEDGSFLIRATTTLAWGLALQTAILMAWLVLLDREALLASVRVWRLSLGAGFLGALASQFWFIGFALTSAANVRTLALVEVLMAQAVAHRLLRQGTTTREGAGLILVVAGVALLLATQM
ncbi:MAG TPA: DMT family transporter [Microvirga sp.]|jgi:drug/metabolite transporter (DMT)-like permease|nr:DMT family transporter [Microvirga sp.]